MKWDRLSGMKLYGMKIESFLLRHMTISDALCQNQVTTPTLQSLFLRMFHIIIFIYT